MIDEAHRVRELDELVSYHTQRGRKTLAALVQKERDALVAKLESPPEPKAKTK